MALFRATKTLTLDNMANILQDAYVKEDAPTLNFNESFVAVGGIFGTDNRQTYLDFKIPNAPTDADTSQAFEGITAIKLRLRIVSFTVGSTSPHLMTFGLQKLGVTWDETTVTYNTRPGGGSSNLVLENASVPLTVGADYDFDATLVRTIGKVWAATIPVNLLDNRAQTAKFTDFGSRDNATVSNRPRVVIQYLQKPPAQITTLAIAPDADDLSRPKLTWTPSKDEFFSKYQVFRKVGAGAYAQVGSDIMVQGQGTFVDTTGGLTENNVILYKIREVNTDTSYNESNEVWFVRPDVSTFTFDDITPDVNQKITATTTAVAYPATPTPVTNTDFFYEWGSSVQSDASYAWSKDATRTHIYAYAGSQTPRGRIKNSLGFVSDLTNLTTGGPTLTVASIAPVAKVKAAPMLQETSVAVTFYGDESYAPAANKTIAATAGYEWDNDYTGTFVADVITNDPTTTFTYTVTGFHTVALRVKDQDAALSPVVTIEIEIVTVTTVNLDVLVDGYEVLDHGRSRQVFRYEGLDTYEVARSAVRPSLASIAGFAFTDADADNVPDDIETLMDVVASNKKVQLTVLGVVRTGTLDGFEVHTEGGWALKYNWTTDVVLDP